MLSGNCVSSREDLYPMIECHLKMGKIIRATPLASTIPLAYQHKKIWLMKAKFNTELVVQNLVSIKIHIRKV